MIHGCRAFFTRTIAQKCYENMNKIDFCLLHFYLCLRSPLRHRTTFQAEERKSMGEVGESSWFIASEE